MAFHRILSTNTTIYWIRSCYRSPHYLKCISNSYLSSNSKRFHSLFTKNSNCLIGVKLVSRNTSYRTLSSSKSVDSSKRQLISWKTLFISGGIVVVFSLAFLHFKREKMLLLEKERRRSLGKAAIGGHFDLIDQNGKRVHSKDFFGKWVLLYFGFTHCPDICPDEIEKMVKAIDILKKAKNMDEVQPVFITVDPERDSTEAIKGYLAEFSPDIIGLTGSKEEIDATTHSFRVYYSAGPRDHENDYIVDHTIIMYLINPEGEFTDYYGQTKEAEDIANGIALNMIKYNKLKKTFGLF